VPYVSSLVSIAIQRSSFNLTSSNSEILIIWYVEESSPKTGSLAFYQKKASSVKQGDVRDMFKKASKGVCTPAIVISPDPLSPTSSTSAAMKTSENTEEEPDDPELVHEGDTPLISPLAQVWGQ
jgi:hypothetical protein